MNPPQSQKTSSNCNSDTAYLKEIEDLKQENDLLRASLSTSTRSQSADSKFTDGSLGSAFDADGLVVRRLFG